MLVILSELWRSRALVDALARRHIATRYRGSFFGFLWSFLNPLCLMAVYTLVFSHYMRVGGGPNYHLLVFAGLLPWICSTSALHEGTSSLVSSGHLITKSMFPAHVLPAVSVITSMIHFILALPILALFMWLAGTHVGVTWLLLPLVIIPHAMLLLGAVLGLSALNVFYRDVQHLLGNILTFVFFLCPVVYPRTNIPERARFWIELNPLALLTEFYQMILVEGVLPPLGQVVYLYALSLAVLAVGVAIHQRNREQFAEAL
ncbi:MAG: ABC transporter permease [Pseudomonadota bacterium]